MMNMWNRARVVVLLAASLSVGAIWTGCRETKPDEPAETTEEARQKGAESAETEEGDEKEGAEQAKADEEEGRNRYQSPEETFSAPIPPKWEAKQKDGYATMVSPEGDLEVHLMSVETEEPVAHCESSRRREDFDARFVRMTSK